MDASQRPPLRNSTSRHSITIKTTINEEATGIENEVMIRASSTSSINRIREDYEQRFRNEREQQMHEDDEHRLRIDIDPFPSEIEQRVPLIRTNTATSVIRTVTPLNVSGLIGILYAILGGIVASDTLLLTKNAFGSSNLQDLVFLSLGIGLIVVGVWVLTKSQPETKIDLELPVE
ncbi:hypothetical protein HDV02_001700 [Globomyces sp. JEL0801]|nr:hypothetical protein HDV02_001700 [Globomyces sp. JEL0801]